MAENSELVSVRFESTMNNENSEPILLSGPIQVFAYVDTLDELSSDTETGAELLDAIKSTSIDDVPRIIVFVKDVTELGSNIDTQFHRGAYFILIETEERSRLKSISAIGNWQEILLGTHSHENIKRLEALEKTTISHLTDKGNLVIDKNGVITAEEIPTDARRYLPDLPDSVKARIEQLNKYNDIKIPDDSQWNHLDAPLDQLADTYDWMKVDKNGNYVNLAVGNCKKLYEALLLNKKFLYIGSNYQLTREEAGSLGEINLEVYKVNYDPINESEEYENIKVHPSNTNRYLLSLALPWNISKDDFSNIFLFDGEHGEFIPTDSYMFVDASENNLIVAFTKQFVLEKNNEVKELTVLYLKNSQIDRMTLKEKIEDGSIIIDDINVELAKLYFENALSRKPNVPRLYLSTDEYGTIYWDNKFLPTQTFYHNEKTIDRIFVEENRIENGQIRVVFEDANYNIETDYILLLHNGFFEFNKKPNIIESGEDLVYYFDESEFNLDDNEDGIEDSSEADKLTVVIIRGATSESIADEIADKYLSKADAIEILNRGKITFDDLATKSDLLKYSKINHTHSEYALKDHNHDYRYANYYHTHPEITSLIAVATNTYTERVQEWMDELDGKNRTLLTEFVLSLGLESYVNQEDGESYYRIKDKNVILSDESVDSLNDLITYKTNSLDLLLDKDTHPTLEKALEVLAAILENEIISSEKVVLDKSIPVKQTVGAKKAGKDSFFNSGETLSEILTEIFNPRISEEEVYRILKPTTINLKWYIKKENNILDEPEYIEINTNILRNRFIIDNIHRIYFKVVDFKNEFGEECVSDTVVRISGIDRTVSQTTHLFVAGEENSEYHEYILDLSGDEFQPIDFYWTVEIENVQTNGDKIYSNYGSIDGEKTVSLAERTIHKETGLNYVLPKIFIGTTDVIDDNIKDVVSDSFSASYLEKPFNYIATLHSGGENTNIITLLVDKDIIYDENEEYSIAVKDVENGERIENYFKTSPIDVDFSDGDEHKEYEIFYYKVSSPAIDQIKLRVLLLKSLNSLDEEVGV